jgi:hypothetical protein
MELAASEAVRLPEIMFMSTTCTVMDSSLERAGRRRQPHRAEWYSLHRPSCDHYRRPRSKLSRAAHLKDISAERVAPLNSILESANSPLLSLLDHLLSDGLRVTERASLAGNVSLSSSSSRWSAQCQSTFSDIELVAGALFRGVA